MAVEVAHNHQQVAEMEAHSNSATLVAAALRRSVWPCPMASQRTLVASQAAVAAHLRAVAAQRQALETNRQATANQHRTAAYRQVVAAPRQAEVAQWQEVAALLPVCQRLAARWRTARRLCPSKGCLKTNSASASSRGVCCDCGRRAFRGCHRACSGFAVCPYHGHGCHRAGSGYAYGFYFVCLARSSHGRHAAHRVYRFLGLHRVRHDRHCAFDHRRAYLAHRDRGLRVFGRHHEYDDQALQSLLRRPSS